MMDYLTPVYDFVGRYRKAVLALLAVFILSFSVSVLFRGAIGAPYRTDVTVFLRAAQAADLGQDIYDAKTERQWNYVYMPLLAVLLKPVADMPLWLAVLGWYFLSIVMLWGTLNMTAHLRERAPPENQIAWLALVLSCPMMLNTLSRGQFGVFSVFFAVLCFYLYKRGQGWGAGFFLAFAIVIKLSPILFLLGFFVLERAWRVVLSAFLGFILFVWVIPGLMVGWDVNEGYLKTWYDAMHLATSKFAQQSQLWSQLLDPYAEDNQSFYAVLLRLFGPARDQLVAGSDTVIRLVSRGLGLILLGLVAAVSIFRQSKKLKEGLFVEYSLLLMVMLYASPVSESHHYTAIYLLYAAAFYVLKQKNLSKTVRQVMEVSVWICSISMLCGLIFDPLNYVGAFVWGSLILWVTLFGIHFLSIHKGSGLESLPGDQNKRGVRQ